MKIKNRVAAEHVIGEYKFYIHYFGAWTAQRIGLRFKDILARATASAAVEIGGVMKNMETENFFDLEANAALVPALIKIMRELDTSTLEDLTKELIINHKNIAFEPDGYTGSPDPRILDYDAADQIFSGDLQDMYILIAHVLKANYESFFVKGQALFGSLKESIMTAVEINTASWT